MRRSTLRSIGNCCWKLETGFRKIGTFATRCQLLSLAVPYLEIEMIFKLSNLRLSFTAPFAVRRSIMSKSS